MKTVLFLATVPSMIVNFNTRNIRILQSMGYEVHGACNFKDRSAWTDAQAEKLKQTLLDMDVKIHQIDFPRKPYHPIQLVRSYRQTRRLARSMRFTMIHNQSCVSGILGRIAFKNKCDRIMHTEHGFYYFKGGPLLNWIFYPFDWLCSLWTDALVTINRDDFAFSQKYTRAKRHVYIPGVGIDTHRFGDTVIDRGEMKRQLGIPEDAFVVLSVGELNTNKNHATILRAIHALNDENICYVICGEGAERENLYRLAEELGMKERVVITGIVPNVNEYYKMADVFTFPSKREGLGLAALEAMAAGLPIVTSNRNGINDYAQDGKTGFMLDPNDIPGFARAILELKDDPALRERMGAYNLQRVKAFSQEATDEIMSGAYEAVLQDQTIEREDCGV